MFINEIYTEIDTIVLNISYVVYKFTCPYPKFNSQSNEPVPLCDRLFCGACQYPYVFIPLYLLYIWAARFTLLNIDY